jgi:hypothetical protein
LVTIKDAGNAKYLFDKHVSGLLRLEANAYKVNNSKTILVLCFNVPRRNTESVTTTKAVLNAEVGK